MSEFNLVELTSELSKVFAAEALERDINFRCSVPEEAGGSLRGDAERLRLLLFQLLANAVKFTRSGSVELEVKRETEQLNSVTLIFSVSDSGCGIQSELRESLIGFLENDEIRHEQVFDYPAGLGLSMARTLAGQLDASLSFSSEEGSGATFRLQVSFEKVLPSGEAGADGDSSSASILVVDDNETNLAVVIAMMERCGHSVRGVRGGAEALEQLADRHFDLVFMDLQMPEMDGFECALRIRSTDSLVLDRNVPVIALTAHKREDDDQLCMAAGMNDYLHKPIDIDQLKACISAVMSARGHHLIGWKYHPVLEQSDLRRRIGNDEELLSDLLELSLEDIPGQIQSLRRAIGQQDEETAMRAAHTIKGASDNIGAFAMREVALAMEIQARRPHLGELERLLPRLEWELKQFRHAVDELQRKGVESN